MVLNLCYSDVFELQLPETPASTVGVKASGSCSPKLLSNPRLRTSGKDHHFCYRVALKEGQPPPHIVLFSPYLVSLSMPCRSWSSCQGNRHITTMYGNNLFQTIRLVWQELQNCCQDSEVNTLQIVPFDRAPTCHMGLFLHQNVWENAIIVIGL